MPPRRPRRTTWLKRDTPPAALGEGRFAAEDFLREITALSDKFETIRIDGEDYRKRDVDEEAVVVANADLDEAVSHQSGIVAVDDFSAVISHLATIHPSRFVGLVEDLDAVVWREVTVLHNQGEALRLVALVDRLYDARVAIVNSGVGLDHVFDDTMLHGGYRKKYLRAVSRMIALTQLAQDPQGSV